MFAKHLPPYNNAPARRLSRPQIYRYLLKPLTTLYKVAQRSYNILPLLSFASLSAVVAFWFIPGLPIGYGDTGIIAFFHNPSYLLKVFSYTWFSQSLTGYPAGYNVTVIPMTAFFAIMQAFHIPEYLRQFFAYYMVMFTSMLFMHYFLLYCFNNHPNQRIIAFVGAVFYTFNPFTMINYWYHGILGLYIIPASAALLLAIENSVRSPSLISYLLFAFVISIFSIAFLNPAFAIPILLLTFFYWIFRQIINKTPLIDLLKSAVSLFLLSILINAWFLFPLVSTALSAYDSATSRMNPLDTLKVASSGVNLGSLMRLLPIRLDSPIWLYKDPPWRFAYNTWPFIVISFFAFSTAILPLLRRQKDARLVFWSITLIIGLFLSCGVNQPLGFVFELLFNYIPYFHIFRSPTNKFLIIVILAMTIMFALGVAILIEHLRWQWRLKRVWFALGSLAIVSGWYTFPMWTGAVVHTPIRIRGGEISSFVKVPAYYDDMARFLQEHEKDNALRTLVFPLRRSTYVTQSWESGYDGPDYTWLLLQTPTFSYLADGYYASAQLLSRFSSTRLLSDKINDSVALALFEERLNQEIVGVIRAAGVLGAKYLIVQNDVDLIRGQYEFRHGPILHDLMEKIKSAGLDRVVSFGQLDVYLIPVQYRFPMVYATQQVICPVESLDDIVQVIMTRNDIWNDPIAILLGDNPLQHGSICKEAHMDVGGSVLRVQAVHVNSVRWDVVVQGTNDPFILVVLESFDPGWKAFVVSRKAVGIEAFSGKLAMSAFENIFDETFTILELLFNGRRINEQKHMRVNGFANGWLIDPGDFGSGDLFITVYFVPQLAFYAGVFSSGLALLVVGAYLGICFIKKNKTTTVVR